MKATAAAAIAGLVAGILAGRLPETEPQDARQTSEDQPESNEACERQEAALTARLSFLESRERELIREQIVETYKVSHEIGEPLVWPIEPPERLARDRLERTLDEAASKRGAEVLSLDCEEYPCLAAIRQPVSAASPFARQVIGSYRRFDIIEHRVEVGDDAFEAVLFYPKTWAGRGEKLNRLRFRAETQVDWLARVTP